ncbi:MAG TPA: prephenate dehydrogenase/arogenate dehydrogenase family protein [Syntrophales bacterium]|nr:prephenate dehydrogenase/arogenate dehydrogenase family protein [Syntrophales bacterium]HOL58829.1 prephenate dehydrogenase/arogenate dehydrogenase family protein [Syntrophales bacterium]HPO35156.1 prephenate dehydrogenase/arogenate dehydrogenase family protein [Syntrophales bacterium]
MVSKPLIGIIGGKGAMGSWFARFFTQGGYQVLISDLDTALTLNDLTARSDVVVVSVPISVTGEVIKKAGPLLAPNKLLMDLTSLKTRPVEAMLKYTTAEVIGLHPLFGPDVPEMKGQNVVICPARGEKWISWLRELLTHAGALVVEMTPERHDELMALVQAMNHLNTILMGLTLKEMGVSPPDLNAVSTPVFRTKLDLIKRVTSQDPALCAEIIGGNPYLIPVLRAYERNWECLKAVIERGDIPALINMLKKLPEHQG